MNIEMCIHSTQLIYLPKWNMQVTQNYFPHEPLKFWFPMNIDQNKKRWCHSSLYKFVYSIALTRFVLNCFKLNCRRQRKVFKIHSLRKEKVSRKKEGCGWTYKKEKRWTISEFCSVNLQFSNILLCWSIKKIIVIDLNNLFKVLMTTVLGWNRSIK